MADAAAPTAGKVGRFRSAEGRARFDAAYDAALASWPVPPKAIDVPTSYGTTRVQSCGAADGTPIVLLPALLATSVSWSQNVGPLGADHPVFALDTVCDAGRSTQTRAIGRKDGGGTDFAAWLDEVLDGLGVARAHLVGLSFGAWLALNQAMRTPDRVASVTAIEPPGVITRGRIGFVVHFGWAGVIRTDKAFDRLIGLMSPSRRPPEPLVEVLRCGFHDFKIAQPFAPLLADERLAAIAPPTLFLYGAESPMSDSAKAVARVRRVMANAQADLVPAAGHAPPLERPEVVNQMILDFVAAHG